MLYRSQAWTRRADYSEASGLDDLEEQCKT